MTVSGGASSFGWALAACAAALDRVTRPVADALLASIAFAVAVAPAALSVLGLAAVSLAGFSVAEWRRGGESWGIVALAGCSLVVVAR